MNGIYDLKKNHFICFSETEGVEGTVGNVIVNYKGNFFLKEEDEKVLLHKIAGSYRNYEIFKDLNGQFAIVIWDGDKKILIDDNHSTLEQRHILLGKTFEGRILFIVFTIRTDEIRVISARDLNKRELNLYS